MAVTTATTTRNVHKVNVLLLLLLLLGRATSNKPFVAFKISHEAKQVVDMCVYKNKNCELILRITK